MVAYHVALVHRTDHHQLWEQHERDGKPMDYPQARGLLIEMEQHWPLLHNPGQGYYLIAAPWREATS
jgi:hypothetical protein